MLIRDMKNMNDTQISTLSTQQQYVLKIWKYNHGKTNETLDIPEDFSGYKMEDFINMLLKAETKTIKKIDSNIRLLIRSIERMATNNIINEEVLNELLKIKAIEVWNRKKSLCNSDCPKDKNSSGKLLNKFQMAKLLYEIEEKYINGIYYSTLIQTIYEGIYYNGLKTIADLRLEDIKDKVYQKDNFKIPISNKLNARLDELSGEYHRHRNTEVFNSLSYEVEGIHHDSCFKIEVRNSLKMTDENKTRDKIYSINFSSLIKNITTETLGRPLRGKDIFKSGLFSRVNAYLKKEHNISIVDYSNYSIDDLKLVNDLSKEIEQIFKSYGFNRRATILRTDYAGKLNNFEEEIKGE